MSRSGVNPTVATTSSCPTSTCPYLKVEGTGVRSVNRVTYKVAPGGLHCIYVVKPLAQFQHYHDALLR
ncbi:MAG: hypothetical protein IPN53_22930 [Comamonadaceae bacterium]|nr:hypothetical protein [Comamonadaceae bacterium]